MEKTIQISGLSKYYDGKKVIENFGFSVVEGEVYGLVIHQKECQKTKKWENC